MKSEYKKSILFLQEVVLFAIGIGMALLFWRGRYDTDSFKRTLVGGIGLMIAFFAVFFAEYFNRYVELGESCAKFNSFRVTKGKKAMNMNVCYENILAIDSKRMPLLGIYKVVVRAKNMPGSIPITPVMSHYWKLVTQLCDLAKKYNPQVNISDDLLEEIEKKRDKLRVAASPRCCGVPRCSRRSTEARSRLATLPLRRMRVRARSMRRAMCPSGHARDSAWCSKITTCSRTIP